MDQGSYELLSVALACAERGWHVLPGHTPDPDENNCSCQNGRDCSSPGKHPRIRSGENHSNATTDREQIREWFNRWPDANILIITGEISGIEVLDIDEKNGGFESLHELERRNGDLPDTPISLTGGGGEHRIFEYGGHFDTRAGEIADGIDARSDGGLIVAPPSLHPSGNRYEWEASAHPNDLSPAPVPDWLTRESRSEERKQSPVGRSNNGHPSSSDQLIPEGYRNDTLTSLAGSMRRRGMKDQEIEAALKQVNEDRCRPPLNPSEIRGIVNSISNYEPEEDVVSEVVDEEFRPSFEANNVLAEQEEKGNRMLYVPEQSCWYGYRSDEGYWRTIEKDYVKKMVRDHVKDLSIENREMDRNHYIKEIYTALKHETMHPDNEPLFDAGKNSDTDHVNFSNGVLDWRTGELKEHDPERHDLIQIPHEYDPDALCPRWVSALNDWIPDEGTRQFIKEFIGYGLLPDTSYDKFPFLSGSGKNGKSTFLKVLQELYGSENITNIPLKKLANNSRFSTAYLKDTLVNICADIDPTYLETTGAIKKIVSGDELRGERKHGSSFDFRSITRLIFSANELPKTRDKSTAWYRRLEIVEFPNQFDPEDKDTDPNLDEKLKEEIPGIVNWAIEGLKRLKERGHFSISDTMKESKSAYQRKNDSVLAFFEDRVEETGRPEDKLPAQFLYRKYQTYCEDHGLNPVSQNKMGRKISDMNVEKIHTRFHFCNEHDQFRCDEFHATEEGEETRRKKRTGYTGISLKD
jgi:putative DNA primase/helicase